VVTEDAAIDWSRSDYDPYARTKKFCEHMANQLLPDVPRTIFRPPSFWETAAARRLRNSTWFTPFTFSLRCLFFLCVLTIKIDIVPANYVGKAIVTIHQKEAPNARHLSLSSGTGSQTYQELTDAISQAGGMLKSNPMVVCRPLGGPFSSTVNWVANRRGAAG